MQCKKITNYLLKDDEAKKEKLAKNLETLQNDWQQAEASFKKLSKKKQTDEEKAKVEEKFETVLSVRSDLAELNIKLRRPPVSLEIEQKTNGVEILAFYPIFPKWDEQSNIMKKGFVSEMQKLPEHKQKQKRKAMGVYDILTKDDLVGYEHFEVYCLYSGEKVAEVWATDETLKEWRQVRSYVYADETGWHGCASINAESGVLRFESVMGNDTRDLSMSNIINKNSPGLKKELARRDEIKKQVVERYGKQFDVRRIK